MQTSLQVRPGAADAARMPLRAELVRASIRSLLLALVVLLWTGAALAYDQDASVHGNYRGQCRRLVSNPGAHLEILIWLAVGLIAGLLASSVVGGIGTGLIGDIAVGIVGAFVGGWLFSTLRIGVPVGGVPGTIIVAFVGAILLLVLFRLLRPGRRYV